MANYVSLCKEVVYILYRGVDIARLAGIVGLIVGLCNNRIGKKKNNNKNGNAEGEALHKISAVVAQMDGSVEPIVETIKKGFVVTVCLLGGVDKVVDSIYKLLNGLFCWHCMKGFEG